MTNAQPEPEERPGHVHEHEHGHRHEQGVEHEHSGANDLGARPGEQPLEFWEHRYSGSDRVWSGQVNSALASVVEELEPGRSLDLGSGEGGDVLWLAEQGWEATGIELSRTAVARAREEARSRGLTRTRFIAADLGDWVMRPAVIDVRFEPYDLVTASFLQSPVELPRERILRTAASRVAVGGLLVVVSHAAPPAWAKGHPGDFPTPEQELSTLALDPNRWRVRIAEVHDRSVVGPDGTDLAGTETVLHDTLVVAQRIA